MGVVRLRRAAGSRVGYVQGVDRRAIASRRSVRLVALLREVVREQTAERVGLSASGAAFWLVISVLPTAIAAVSIYGLVVSPQTVAKNLAGLANNGPQSLGATLAQQLQKVAATDHGGLTAGLVISMLLALWSASAGIYNLERAIRAAYGHKPEEYVRARGRALVGAVVVVLSLGIVALISTAAAIVTDYLPVIVVVIIAVPLFVGVVAAIIATLYRYSVGHRLVLRTVTRRGHGERRFGRRRRRLRRIPALLDPLHRRLRSPRRNRDRHDRHLPGRLRRVTRSRTQRPTRQPPLGSHASRGSGATRHAMSVGSRRLSGEMRHGLETAWAMSASLV